MVKDKVAGAVDQVKKEIGEVVGGAQEVQDTQVPEKEEVPELVKALEDSVGVANEAKEESEADDKDEEGNQVEGDTKNEDQSQTNDADKEGQSEDDDENKSILK